MRPEAARPITASAVGAEVNSAPTPAIIVPRGTRPSTIMRTAKTRPSISSGVPIWTKAMFRIMNTACVKPTQSSRTSESAKTED